MYFNWILKSRNPRNFNVVRKNCRNDYFLSHAELEVIRYIVKIVLFRLSYMWISKQYFFKILDVWTPFRCLYFSIYLTYLQNTRLHFNISWNLLFYYNCLPWLFLTPELPIGVSVSVSLWISLRDCSLFLSEILHEVGTNNQNFERKSYTWDFNFLWSFMAQRQVILIL